MLIPINVSPTGYEPLLFSLYVSCVLSHNIVLFRNISNSHGHL